MKKETERLRKESVEAGAAHGHAEDGCARLMAAWARADAEYAAALARDEGPVPKRCPFCRSDEVVAVQRIGSYVMCATCGSYGPDADNEAEAVELWNAALRPSDAEDA